VAGVIRAASLTNFADVARSVGLDPMRLLSEFGLPQRALEDADLKVPIDAVRQLLEAAAERSGVEAFGLLMADTRRLSNLGPVGLLIREQPTLRDALQALRLYTRQLNGALFLTIEEIGDVALIREEIIVGHGGPIRQSTELAIGVVFSVLRAYLGSNWQPRRVCFAHDTPRERSVHDRVFGRRVEFGHDFNGIVFARSDLDLANPHADPAMERYAKQMLEASGSQEMRNMAVQVRDHVLLLLGTGRCTIDVVAQHLGIDRRTVHRHLAAERQTFTAIVDAVRAELASRYLKDQSRSLAEVSSMLGFSAPSGFSRWYRRHHGAAPSNRRSARSRATR